MPSGYRDSKGLEEALELLASLDLLRGVELVYPADINEKNADYVADKIESFGFEIAGIGLDLYSQRKWAGGALSTATEGTREEALELAKSLVGLAESLGVEVINLWPGTDGYDYPFQVDYAKAWGNFVESVETIGSYSDRVRIALEYKIKEPRTHILMGTVGKLLYVLEKVGLDNVGATVDVGHALMAYENLGETIALLGDRLFHLHLNDNYREWDHDMVFGSVHLVELIEMEYWLRKVGYDGWYSLDIFPYRVDPLAAVRESIEMVDAVRKFVRATGIARLDEMVERGDYLGILRMIREKIK